MSDMHPFSAMGQMISRCEQSLEREDWEELNVTKTLEDFQSFSLCNALGYLFENAHQVIKQRKALASLEMPEFLSPIRLHNPEIRLKFSDEEGNPINLMPIGEVPVGYMDIVLDTTLGNEGIPYTGPHFAGVVDTGMFTTEFVREGIYSFFTPLRLVEVSELHVPREFN